MSAITEHPLDVARLRQDFPMLGATVNGQPLLYFDNAATTHKPQVVIDRLYRFYTQEYAKNDEGHTLSQGVTRAPQQGGSDNSQTVSFSGWTAKPRPTSIRPARPPSATSSRSARRSNTFRASAWSASRSTRKASTG